MSEGQIGLILGIGGCISIVSQPFWGIVSDSRNTIKKVLLFIMSISALVGFYLFQSEALFILVIAVGLMYIFFMPSDPLIESLNYQSAQRFGVPYGSVKMFGALGYATASLIIGFVTNQVGMSSIGYLFLGYGVVAIGMAFTLTDVETSRKPLRMMDMRKFLSERSTLAFFLMVLVLAIPHRTNDTFVGLYISSTGGSLTQVGYAWFIMTIIEVLFFAFVHRLIKPGQELKMIALAGVIYTLRYLLMSLTDNPSFIVLLQLLQGPTFVLFYAAAVQYMYAIIPEEWKATGQTILAVILFGLSGIVSSFLGGFLFEALGGDRLYAIMACVSLIGAGYCYLLQRQAAKRSARVQ